MPTPTITALLADTEPRLYHLGRRVEPCPQIHFHQFEQQQIAWPSPWQGSARIALAITPAPERDPIIWCLALPLDEQSMLIPSQRDAFLEQLLAALQRDEAGRLDLEAAAGTLKNVAIAFQPDQHRLALLHARLCHDMGRSPSQHFEAARAFFTTSKNGVDWTTIGLQGVADFVVRRSADDEGALAIRLSDLDNAPLTALGECLTHAAPTEATLIDALMARYHDAVSEEDQALAQACSGAALSSSDERAAQWFDSLLERDVDASILATMAARGWRHLEHESRPLRYLEHIARLDEHDFRMLLNDLCRIPRLRLPMILALKQAPAGSALAERINALQRDCHE
ncbi:DUF3549 family protein [Kushneria aurantia]|uniref:DUF3549 family protein n=1 Tax=Kushneria aurantia TaxID=504092 RepID=A0ABV6G828_9GAMM|nr:DUF3549 family protein [Kushneria aurantia]